MTMDGNAADEPISYIDRVASSPVSGVLLSSVAAIRAIDGLRVRLADQAGVNRTENEAISHIAESARATPKDLSARLVMTTGAVTALLDRLETGGLIMRVPNPNDRRSTLLELTETGKAVVERNYSEYARVIEKVAESRSAKELAIIAGFLDELATAFVDD
jgi:DNA-binding MarR family transcriptional regulator